MSESNQRTKRISAADLPLTCPMPEDSLWNMHPRVSLPIEENDGEMICRYCGTQYVLEHKPHDDT